MYINNNNHRGLTAPFKTEQMTFKNLLKSKNSFTGLTDLELKQVIRELKLLKQKAKLEYQIRNY